MNFFSSNARTMVATLLLVLGNSATSAENVIHIQNVYRADQQINIENGAVESSPSQPGWLSAQWVIEPVDKSTNVRIKNVWKGTYLNVETGSLQATPIEPGWLSAQWTIEPVDGGSYRIKNAWKGTYLHTESGALGIGEIQPGWQSALWSLPGYSQTSASPAAATTAEAELQPSPILPHNDQRQCVKNMAAFNARVKWYNPTDFVKDSSNNFKLISGREPVQNDNIAVLTRSCIQKDVRMTAVVSVEGGEYANKVITIAAGTVLAAGGAAICVGTAGAGCGPALTGAAAGISTLIAGTTAFLPDAKDEIYMGSPGLLEVHGTVWDANVVETRAWDTGKAVGESCEENKDCANNQCGRATADKNAPKVCCAAGSTALPYAGYDYCDHMPNGSTCWSDAQCASDNCSGNLSGMQRGKCK